MIIYKVYLSAIFFVTMTNHTSPTLDYMNEFRNTELLSIFEGPNKWE